MSNTATSITLRYLAREPKRTTAKPPLLLLLHGVGSNEKDLFSFSHLIPDHFLVVSARGPFTIAPDRFAWYQVDFSTGKPVINNHQEQKSRGLIVQFIDDLKSHYSFDDEKVFVGGFSQGAIMSYTVGLLHPEKIKGIIAMGGRLLEEVKPLVRSAMVTNLSVLITHGIDDTILPVKYARQGRDYLTKLCIHPVYKEYPTGHGISQEMLSDVIHMLDSVS